MKKFAAITAIIAAGAIATGCAASEEPDTFSEQGKTTKQVAEKAAPKEKREKADPTPKWKRNMDRVQLGMRMAKVKRLVGKPDETDASETTVPEMNEETFETYERKMTMDTWTYGNAFTDKTTWILSFTDGKLDSKSRL